MSYRTLVTAAVLLMLCQTVAHAQMSGGLTNPISFGLAAGTAVPNGALGDVTNAGFNVTGILGIKPPILPIGFRVDASYNMFGYTTSGHAHVSSVTGNIVLNAPFPIFHPYVIGGLGYYNIAASSSRSSNDMGFNVGAGLSVSIPLTGLSIFAEGRYNHVNTSGASTEFTPFVLGVMF
jgi:opacity protein-like surface antigen